MDLEEEVSLVEPELKRVKGLARDDVRRELNSRGIQPVGIHGEDAQRLKVEFDKEYAAALAAFEEARAQRARRVLEDEHKLRVEQNAAIEEKEESKYVASSAALALFLQLMRSNKSPPEGCFKDGCPAMGRALARHLPSCTTLVALDLSHGDLGDSGAIALARALQKSTTQLKRLELENNNIGPLGASEFGKALTVNQSLLSLSLENNNLTTDYQEFGAIRSLAAALSTNKTLTALNLNRTTLGVNGVALVSQLMQGNESLLILDVDYNGNVKHEDVSAILRKIAENKVLFAQREAEARRDRRAQRREQQLERQQREEELRLQEERRLADERAKKRQEERIRKYEEDKAAHKAFLAEAHTRAITKQAEWEERELSKKKKGKGKGKK